MNPLQKVIKRHRVKAGSTPSDPDPVTKRAAPRAPRKGARLVHVDGRLQAIEVTCACGEVMVIEIEYENETVSEEA